MAKKKITTRIKESSWQTTVAGILALAASGAMIYGQAAGRPNIADIAAIGQTGATLFGAGGLLVAKDAGK